NGDTWDDEVSSALAIPFSFTFNGTGYTSCFVSSNGFLTFGATAPGGTNYTPISAGGYAGAVSAFGRDLVNQGTAGATFRVRSETLGSSPNRTFVVEWRQARRYDSGGVTGDNLTFQIRLSETTNVIRVVYGTMTITSTTALPCQVGLRGATTSDFNNRATTTNWAATTAGGANTASCSSSNTVKPASGQTYTWTPPVVTCSAPALSVGSITATSASASWTCAGCTGSFVLEYGPVGYTPGAGATAGATGTLVSATATNPNAIAGLVGNTAYTVALRQNCGAGGYSTNSTVNITTLPGCGSSFTDSGGSGANYGNNENATTTICPVTPGDQVTVTFSSFRTQAANDALFIYNGNSVASPLISSGSTATSPVGGFNGNLNTTLPGPFTSSDASGCLTFKFVSDGSTTQTGWVAAVTCAPPPACPNPSGLNATGITGYGATLNWTNSAASSYDYEIRTSGTPGSGATGLATSGNVASTPATVTGLSGLTTYSAYVRSVCAGPVYGTWMGPVNFTTLPGCGSNFYDSGGAAGNYGNNQTRTTTICPRNAGDGVTVTFSSFDVEETYDALYVFNGPTVGAPKIASTNPVPGGTNTTYGAGGYWGTSNPGPFTSTDPGGCLTFGFTSDDSQVYTGWVAAITCAPLPACLPLTGVNLTNITGVSVNLGWTNTGAISYDYEIRTSGAAGSGPTGLAVGNNVASGSPAFTVSGLTPSTAYTVYVRGVCGVETSSWTTGAPFSTVCDVAALPYLQNF
ncbi:MAG TPA: fibronectin type III domain-containing protein, partial [Flavobacteriales bacterium]|nr:fibronectin type III domain-containing protein [Flavobacteriales bacterium]